MATLLRQQTTEQAHSLSEDVFFTALSLLVIVVAAVAVFTPPTITLAVSAQPAAVNPNQIAFYGTLVDEFGEPVKNAEVAIFDAAGTRVAYCRTKTDGSFSCQFNDSGGPYTVSISYDSDGTTVTGSADVDCEPGYDYGVQASTEDVAVVFVALPGY